MYKREKPIMYKRMTVIILCIALCLPLLIGCETQEPPIGTQPTGGGEDTVYSENSILPDYTQTMNEKEYTLSSENLQWKISWKNGVKLLSIFDTALSHEYLPKSFSLFNYATRENLTVGGYKSDGIQKASEDRVTKAYLNSKGTKLTLEVTSKQIEDLAFTVVLEAENGQVHMQITTHNLSVSERIVYLDYPTITQLEIPGEAGDARVMLPSEIGWVGPYDNQSSYGNGFDLGYAVMPTGWNVMQVAALYNAKGEGGIYFFDRNGDVMSDIPALNLYVGGKTVTARWTKQLEGNTSAVSAVLTTGLIHDDDWHTAVDAYMLHQSDSLTNDAGIPAWLLEAGAVYSARREGTGGTYQAFPENGSMLTRISHYDEMDKLLEEANSFGTDVVLLVDWYEVADTSGLDADLASKIKKMPYWNKGDYVPRSDMGGEEAFRNGIAKVHEQGGKVMVYVEPFIIFHFSNIGRTIGFRWGAHNVMGALDDSYALCYTMVAAYDKWQDYIVGVCEKLVQEYDVDGIFLDSLGWQWNRLYYTRADEEIYSYEEYNQGFLELNNRVREAIRKIKPDAVVLSESAGGPLPAYNDGGWASQNVWGDTTTAEGILASPVRYASNVNFITNGNNIAELNQVFAAGFSLAVSDYWNADSAYIKKLVQIRRDYTDAMVYGEQEQYKTDRENVVAYGYVSEEDLIVPIVNAGHAGYSGTVNVRLAQGSILTDLLSGKSYTVGEDGTITVAVDAGELLVLHIKKG